MNQSELEANVCSGIKAPATLATPNTALGNVSCFGPKI